ncbi:MAG: SDR family oxidoreductase, partial [Pleurocapsa sp. SU_196_0]|nr:SDR family oxidoreductase [Pleurocapsa sp. SU_196_0]
VTSLENQVCIITGSTGIGAATAELFHARGAKLCVVGRDENNLVALQERIPGLVTISADLTHTGAARGVVTRALEAFGRVDVLVNVAGISGRKFGDGPVHEATDDGWDVVMDTNAKTTFSMCREVLETMMAQQSGSIVNMASVLAYAPNKDFFATHAYAACNGARISLTKAMAAYYAVHGIRVNAIAPGLIATPMSTRAQTNPDILEYMKTKQPITGSLGEALDCAEAIAYLATASFVTGVVLEVAGGWSVVG